MLFLLFFLSSCLIPQEYAFLPPLRTLVIARCGTPHCTKGSDPTEHASAPSVQWAYAGQTLLCLYLPHWRGRCAVYTAAGALETIVPSSLMSKAMSPTVTVTVVLSLTAAIFLPIIIPRREV